MIFERPQYKPLAEQFLHVEIGDDMGLEANCKVIQMGRILQKKLGKEILNVVATWNNLLVQYDFMNIKCSELIEVLDKIFVELKEIDIIDSRIVELPILYGGKWGPDLEKVAENNGISVEEAIHWHSDELQWCGFIGFVPGHPLIRPLQKKNILQGFLYEHPRTYTPEGTVGNGGISTSIYSVPVSGGYAMIGRLPVPLYDACSIHPDFQTRAGLLQASDRIKFRPIERDEYDDLAQMSRERRYKFNIKEGTFSLKKYMEEE